VTTTVPGAPCLTVDVEDFYEGMRVLGHDVVRSPGPAPGLVPMLQRLDAMEARPKLTLFVVGRYASSARHDLAGFAASGHEIASHGPDHGRLPGAGLVDWLRRGRLDLEDLLGVAVTGFRSPRFDIPGAGLARYRHALAEAGFTYVSDTAVLGAASPVRELPVFTWRGLPLGGGSYQRLLPRSVATRLAGGAARPTVLYYHSYDFDGSLPGTASVRTAALARQILGRRRIAPLVWRIAERYGSVTCTHALG
jgi:peptidoglycan/xylan/chitin deacetylase (PgdA/CDA1 family)